MILTRNPSSLTNIVEVPPCRAYVCIAFFRDMIDGVLQGTVSWVTSKEKELKGIYRTASRLSLKTGIWMVICGRSLSTSLLGRGLMAE